MDQFAAVVSKLTFQRPTLPIVSTVTGSLIDVEMTNATYWVEHVRRPVRFREAVRVAEELGAGIYLEVGPGGTLSALGGDCTSRDTVFAPLLRENRDETSSFLLGLAAAHVAGSAVDWAPLFDGAGVVDLPTYRFQRQRHWVSAAPAVGTSGTGLAQASVEAPAEPERHPVVDLTSLPAWEAREVLARRVGESLALVLGHTTSDQIDMSLPFPELGVDSLAAVQLRTALGVAIGQPLDDLVVFEHESVHALTAHLEAQLLGGSRHPHDRQRRVPVRRLASGNARHKLICFDSIAPIRAGLEYAGLAGGLSGLYDVLAVGQPGFRGDEAVPLTVGELVVHQTANALEIADGGPFVLVGHSSGGWVAHAVTRRLEVLGTPPAGLVLSDTYFLAPDVLTSLTARIESLLEERGILDETMVPLFDAYLALFSAWRPEVVSCPVLCLRAEAGLPGVEDPVPVFTQPGTNAMCPGDHFSMLDDRPEGAAERIRTWLSAVGLL